MKSENYEKNLQKAAALCSAKECCTNDIRQKLVTYGSSDDETEKIVQYLTKEKFIDDQRFSIAYAKDKFRFGKWGKTKIGYALRMKKIADEMIENALNMIPEEEYAETLLTLLREKKKSAKFKDDYELRGKLFRFAASRGFESEIILQTLKNI